ncbi:hypothetical protein CLM85_09845 [Streptomyces albidoflavus]|uniref:hypothetical protein n=1 Tax=Streptomyces albidoflavus TaxID=1886 RepID=UPI000BAE192E|nr:hypothetical protein [Streptomyces albidoflavus]PAX82057.1 hypothetical protein CLM81_30045 [Streptomyces albidoflavus]PAX91479.1 hypothetical protein CLM82_09055 [Streptomyces albidoflavus]PBO18604.1 hypothetical protein CLM83_11310 [Streptomyces albidoflavus]PBO24490.1 hypothetical protein CLM85_09845 [Streptomyces albidoflavus]PBO31295.1 hypothetical protein CLM84_03280 [Streptomyces albidoflavus]
MPNAETEPIAGELHIAYQRGWSTDEPTWAVLTHDEATAAELAAHLGGRVREVPVRAGAVEVLLDRDALKATLCGSTSVVNRSVQRQGPGASRTDHAASAAAARSTVAKSGRRRTCDQMVEARAGVGPRPEVSLRIRIAGADDLGAFRLTSTSWEFVESVRVLAAEASSAGERVTVMLSIHTNRMTTRSGMTVVFVHPRLSALEPLAESIRWSLAA